MMKMEIRSELKILCLNILSKIEKNTVLDLNVLSFH